MHYSVFGDSISTFYDTVPEGYQVFYNRENAMRNGLSSVQDLWWHQVIEALGGELLVDAAYSGGRVSGIGFPAANSYERIEALHTDRMPDGILVYLGMNDFGYAVPVSSGQDKLSVTYFYDAYVVMLQRLRQIYPYARIICATIMGTYIEFRTDWHFPEQNKDGIPCEDYNNAIRKACKECAVELADIAATGILCDTLDGSHGTEYGQRQIADAWLRCLEIDRRTPC